MTTALRSRLGNLRNDDGFTLMELAVGLLIAGILVAIGYPAILANEATGHDNAVRADITHYSTVMAEWRVEYGLNAPASIDASAFKAVRKSDGNHFAVVGTPANWCVLGYADGGTHSTPANAIVITEGNLSGAASCPLSPNLNTLVWN